MGPEDNGGHEIKPQESGGPAETGDASRPGESPRRGEAPQRGDPRRGGAGPSERGRDSRGPAGGRGRGGAGAQMDGRGIGSRVHWIGRRREEELPGLMSASTLLAVPALDDNVRGQHIPRAMASGVCVIASEKPALASLLEHEETGLIARAGDLAAWVEALRRASTSPDARKRWSQRARERAEKELAWTQVARRIEGLCLAACGEQIVVIGGAGTPVSLR